MNRKNHIIRSLITVIVTGFILLNSGVEYAWAKQTSQWMPDQKVSGYPDYIFTPYLLADQNRTVHAFSSQWVGEGDRRYAIVYRQWSLMRGWTKPVDVLAIPKGDARVHGALLDAMGSLHLIFWSGSHIYHSSAPVQNADQAPAWSEPAIIGADTVAPSSAALAGDEQGNLIVIYSGTGNGSGVYAVHSRDFGQAWSDPAPIFLSNARDLVPYSLRVYMGESGQLHATWNVVTSLGIDVSLFYARCDVEKGQWSEPVLLNQRVEIGDAFGPSFPSIVEADGTVVVMYNNGNPFVGRPVDVGRPVQMMSVSADGGNTWDEPAVPFISHLGRSGEHSLTVDGEGTAHALFIQRIDQAVDGKYKAIGGIWHSAFQNGEWSIPDRLVSTIPAHDVRAVVVQGNILLAVWREDPGVGVDGIWYSYSVLDVPELPVKPLATASVDYSSVLDVATTIPVLSTPEASPPPELLDDVPPSNLGGNPALPIIIGIVPVTLILIGVVLGYRFLANRRE